MMITDDQRACIDDMWRVLDLAANTMNDAPWFRTIQSQAQNARERWQELNGEPITGTNQPPRLKCAPLDDGQPIPPITIPQQHTYKRGDPCFVEQLDAAVTFSLPNGAQFQVHAEQAPHRGTYLVVMHVGRGALHIEPNSQNCVRLFAPDAKPPKS